MKEMKYCTGCQVLRTIEGGSWVHTRIKRWRCVVCTTKQTISPYANSTTLKRLASEQGRAEA